MGHGRCHDRWGRPVDGAVLPVGPLPQSTAVVCRRLAGRVPGGSPLARGRRPGLVPGRSRALCPDVGAVVGDRDAGRRVDMGHLRGFWRRLVRLCQPGIFVGCGQPLHDGARGGRRAVAERHLDFLDPRLLPEPGRHRHRAHLRPRASAPHGGREGPVRPVRRVLDSAGSRGTHDLAHVLCRAAGRVAWRRTGGCCSGGVESGVPVSPDASDE